MSLEERIEHLDIKYNYRLKEAVQYVDRALDAIQHQREDLPEDRQDSSAPAEGQLPGYDNTVPIRPPSVEQLLKALGETNVITDNDLRPRKGELEQSLLDIKSAMRFTQQEDNLDGKEKILMEYRRVIEEVVEFIEETD